MIIITLFSRYLQWVHLIAGALMAYMLVVSSIVGPLADADVLEVLAVQTGHTMAF